MIPNMSTWSRENVSGTKLGPARRAPDVVTNKPVAYVLGPKELSNTDDGLLSVFWYCTVNNGKLFLGKESKTTATWEAPTELVTLAVEPSEISFTFDQNGKPQVLYLLPTGLYLYWFDPVQAKNVHLLISTTATSGLVALDYPLPTLGTERDIYVFYVVDNGNLMFRIQRDRYDTEYVDGLNLGQVKLVAGNLLTSNSFQLTIGKVRS